MPRSSADLCDGSAAGPRFLGPVRCAVRSPVCRRRPSWRPPPARRLLRLLPGRRSPCSGELSDNDPTSPPGPRLLRTHGASAKSAHPSTSPGRQRTPGRARRARAPRRFAPDPRSSTLGDGTCAARADTPWCPSGLRLACAGGPLDDPDECVIRDCRPQPGVTPISPGRDRPLPGLRRPGATPPFGPRSAGRRQDCDLAPRRQS